jgi:hypothetical protein
MNILYLSPDMSRYQGAMYQRDVMQELARQARVTFYGPGFANFNAEDTLTQVLARCDARPDWVIVGHAWLADAPGAPIRRWSPLSLADSPVPVALILNKEYTNLDAKLEFAKRDRIGVCFSHHHDIDTLAANTGIDAVFWPFGFSPDRFWFDPGAKRTDIGFSGVLQNPTPGFQSDLRARVMNVLFECEGELPLRPRAPWAHRRIEWNALPRNPQSAALAETRGVYKRLDDDAYGALVRRCRAIVCTRSPADLVSPRIFESAASGTIVVAERNRAHATCTLPEMLVEFDSEHDFLPAAERAIGADDAVRARIAHWAREHASWPARVRQMLASLESAVTAHR